MKKFLITFLLTVVIVGGLVYYGYYRFQQYVTHNQEIEATKKQDLSITIIEGLRREEIARIYDKAGVCSYDNFMAATKDLEGYLFPDTYRFYPDTLASTVVEKMITNFQTKTGGATRDQLILASIIEREADTSADREGIAGVYNNRLKIDMKLDADPTVQYGKDTLYTAGLSTNTQSTFKYWQPITQSNYQDVNSPYNTYLNKGLPPASICNPGLKSINAAKNPDNNGYLYFFNRGGKTYYSKTLQEHEAKLAQ